MPVCLENSVHQLDSESDEDYVPPQDDQDSDSEQSDKEDAVVDVGEQGATTDTETKKRRVVFKCFCFFVVDAIIETFDGNGFDHH